MAIIVTCKCGKEFKVKEELAGKRGKCPGCGQVLIVPALASSAKKEKSSTSRPRACPACKEVLQPNAVICLNCGHDLRTGKRIPQVKSPIPKNPSKASVKDPATSTRFLIPMIAGGACLVGIVAAVFLIFPGPRPTDQTQQPAKSNPSNSTELSFEEAFRAGRIAWQGVKNTQLTTRTPGMQKVESSEFSQKFKYDQDGRKSIDTSGYKTYTWPDREATFGPGAVIRLTENSNVREGTIRAGEEWTWTGQQWTAKLKESPPTTPIVKTGNALAALGATGEELKQRFGPLQSDMPSAEFPGASDQIFVSGSMKIIATVFKDKCGAVAFNTLDGSPFQASTIDQLLAANSEGYQWQSLQLGGSPTWAIRTDNNGEKVLLMAIWPDNNMSKKSKLAIIKASILPERAKQKEPE